MKDVCESNVLKIAGFDLSGDGACSDNEYLNIIYCSSSYPDNIGSWSCGGSLYCCENSSKYGYNFIKYEPENTADLCQDKHDNDCDREIDCDDEDCNNRGDYDGSELACTVCKNATWVKEIGTCCGDGGENENWVAENIGACCNGKWYNGSNCCSNDDCKRMRIICTGDFPNRFAECSEEKKICEICGPCTSNNDCEEGYCCEREIDESLRGKCKGKGSIENYGEKSYLCVPGTTITTTTTTTTIPSGTTQPGPLE